MYCASVSEIFQGAVLIANNTIWIAITVHIKACRGRIIPDINLPEWIHSTLALSVHRVSRVARVFEIC